MRIGIVTGEYPPMQGGVGAYTEILAEELVRQGQTVSVLSSEAARSTNPQIQRTNTVRGWGFGSLGIIRNWAIQEQLDILNIQFQTAAFGMSPWIHFLPHIMQSIPVVTTFHDLRYPYLFPKAGGLREWIVLHLARASSGIILTNHEDQWQLSTLPKQALIPIGSNILKPLPHEFDAVTWRQKAGAQASDFLIAYFGLFNRSKGLITLLESLAALRQQNVPARLIVVGGGTGSSDPTNMAFVEAFRAKIEQLNLHPYIYETGYLEDDTAVGAYLAASDVVALPFVDGASYRRGSLMAAIRYGCAIVTTEPQTEILAFKDGTNMRFVEAEDRTSLTEALHELYQSPALRERLKKGAAQLAHLFNWPQIARDYIAFFEQVCE